MVSRLSPVERPPLVASRSVVPALVKFMFFSVMFDAVLMSAPRLVVLWIVPPVPSVVPVPFTVKLPLVLRSLMPLGAPLAETLVSEITSGVVLDARVISTAVPVVVVIAPLVAVMV